jgi:hypothetical protein
MKLNSNISFRKGGPVGLPKKKAIEVSGTSSASYGFVCRKCIQD